MCARQPGQACRGGMRALGPKGVVGIHIRRRSWAQTRCGAGYRSPCALPPPPPLQPLHAHPRHGTLTPTIAVNLQLTQAVLSRCAVTLPPLGRTPPAEGPLPVGPLRPPLKLPLARDEGRLLPPVSSRSSRSTLSTVLRPMNLCKAGQHAAAAGRPCMGGRYVPHAVRRLRCSVPLGLEMHASPAPAGDATRGLHAHVLLTQQATPLPACSCAFHGSRSPCPARHTCGSTVCIRAQALTDLGSQHPCTLVRRLRKAGLTPRHEHTRARRQQQAGAGTAACELRFAGHWQRGLLCLPHLSKMRATRRRSRAAYLGPARSSGFSKSSRLQERGWG